MPKTFTITEGLENLGAFKTGGQGSVYKARRNGTTITAIKLLPTPIYSESGDDKNFLSFQNEVEKLRKVNETPNPHVVNILSSGITDSGSFPYIEMEFIDGPDLEEQLKPTHKPVFRISETIKVARHISEALAHCHKVGVKHGDIKPNNVKLNSRNGNFVLLDFGLALMSDEQRRTSLRHAGAIEFMAPEQNAGELLFQTDIYSFGVILYELLAGQVPFPIAAGSESARNNVMVAHMENDPPPILPLRQQNMPDAWSADKKEYQLDVPKWLLEVVARCLHKDPAMRYANGIELHDVIVRHSNAEPIFPIDASESLPSAAPVTASESIKPERAAAPLPPVSPTPVVPATPPAAIVPDKPRFDHALSARGATKRVDPQPQPVTRKRRASPLLLVGLLLVAVAVLAGIYFFKPGKEDNTGTVSSRESAPLGDTVPLLPDPAGEVEKDQGETVTESEVDVSKTTPATQSAPPAEKPVVVPKVEAKPASDDTPATRVRANEKAEDASANTLQYKVRSRAYFHNEPNENTRRNAFIVHWNNAVLKPLEVKDDFVYIVFTNHLGQTSRGWLRVQDLVKVERKKD